LSQVCDIFDFKFIILSFTGINEWRGHGGVGGVQTLPPLSSRVIHGIRANQMKKLESPPSPPIDTCRSSLKACVCHTPIALG